DYVTTTEYQTVKETADLYERVIGSSENEINNNVSRIIATSDVIQQEVSSMEFGGRNYFIKSESEPNKLLEWASGLTGNNSGSMTTNYIPVV
ncbi:hypothetical protein CVR96_27855, partial [Salmonella enterica subsp. enterica serovar Typhimurium]|uniref:hypothetical protein n=1 Tax=Salmonella enterica TaxID=28901 RepID=UPI000CAD934B